jgi:AmmeMemoRadiSam system protein A
MHLTQEEKDHLKELALESIKGKFEHEPEPELGIDSETLKTNCGAFVTLKTHGSLRGCIGLVVGMKPLYKSVTEMARAAAFDDPRFTPLTKDEVDKLEIEISALSPLEKIDDPAQIEVGKHGIMLQHGYHSGLLLPQVATEYGWDRITFLKHTCLKAGLPENAWRDPETEIQIFSAEVF